MDTFMESPWYDKLFWLFFFGIIAFVAVIWIKVLFEMIRFRAPTPKRAARAGGAGGFGESASIPLMSHDSGGSDSGSTDHASDSSGGGGGSDFSGGGGESGGGGASGSWS